MSLEVAPPPSVALKAAIAGMGPVRTRHPVRTAVLLLLLSAGWAALGLLAMRLRPDLQDMPIAWLSSLAAIWLTGFVVPFWWLTVPRPGAVLPAIHRATAPTVAGAVLLTAIFVATWLGWPTSFEVSTGYVAKAGLACFGLGTAIAIVPLLVAAIVSRKVLAVGAAKAGALTGAAAGALGVITLELHCPAGGMHPLIAHGACILVAATVGALAFDVASRRAR